MVPVEEDQAEKFIGGLPDNIQENVIAAEPMRLQDRDNHGQQPPFKKPNVKGQNMARAYTARKNDRKSYNRSLPLCNKCKLYHEGLLSSCNATKDIKADATAVKVTVERDVEVGIDACIDMKVNVEIDVEDEVEEEVESSDRGTIEVRLDMVVEIDIPDGMLMPDVMERLEQIEEGLQDIYDHAIEIPLQRIEDIEMGQR
nr:hypothetical protein [Tanacetum cinerariifolium]